MNRPCEIDNCGFFARPNRRTCTTHRHIPAEKFEAFVDEIEVDFVVRERLSAAGLERGEQILVAARLADERVPDTEIARLAGVSTRTVRRWIAEDRAAA